MRERINFPVFEDFKNPSVIVGGIFFLVVFFLVGYWDYVASIDGDIDWKGILTEAHGLLMDILIFGILITLFNEKRNSENQIKNYYDQLQDFKAWDGEEGVLRKVGILKRLNEMKAPLPELSAVQLPEANLYKFNLKGAILAGANFSNATLFEAELTESYLRHANFTNATLMEAKLERTNLSFANLEKANLLMANLTNADLSDAKLINSKLTGANLQYATLFNANLNGADLSNAFNLTCEQINSADIDGETKVPDYMEKIWDEYGNKYICKMKKNTN